MKQEVTVKQRIAVTGKHIFLGVPSNGKSCPIALALQEAMPEKDVRVSTSEILIFSNLFPTYIIELEDSIRNRIAEFDINLGMVPFEFYLEIPERFPEDFPFSRGKAWEPEAEAQPEVEYDEVSC